jgi:hypothetical protein
MEVRAVRLEDGPEQMHMTVPAVATSSVTSSVSRRDKASATVLRRPGRYSIVKLKPKSLLIHCCYGTVERRWSSKNLRL